MAKYDLSNLPDGVIQLKNQNDILFYMMQPDIEEVLKSDKKNRDRIEDILDVLIEIIKGRDIGKDEFFRLIEIYNIIDRNAADIYLLLFEEIYKRKELKTKK